MNAPRAGASTWRRLDRKREWGNQLLSWYIALESGSAPARGAIGQQGLGSQYGYGLGGCPPGLAKKDPECVPPGLANRPFAVGQRMPLGSQGLLGYNSLPYNLRSQYGAQLDPYSRYAYDNDYLYRVDPRTLIVQQVLSVILR